MTSTLMNPGLDTATPADPRWRAVMERDRHADGRFVYSVRTTGVYCRPSCGARLARPENVRFHATPAEAVQAGFRPCKRCRPDQWPETDRHTELVTAACRALENAEVIPTLKDLAQQAGLSPFHFHRLFKGVTGVTPRAYAAARRAQRVREGLSEGQTVTRAMLEAGYGSSARFYAQSESVLGMKPTSYRNGGHGAEIRYTVTSCALGAVLVAATAQGLCSVALGDDAQTLVREFLERFPRATLVGDDPEFAQWVKRVVAFIEMPAEGLNLPLDIRGTAFQQRVWRALQGLAPGETTTYTDLAKGIGQPSAVRAVASACAANELAVIVPCHRVLRRDGSLSGYRWGVARKGDLLRREALQRGRTKT